jgi:Bacterial alpha-L-rhamnosidase 6 hairpin glycosidase domain
MRARVVGAVALLGAVAAVAPSARAVAPPGPWDQYNLAPASRTVEPTGTYRTGGAVSTADGVTSLGPGAYVTYDFGKEVGGFVHLRFAPTSEAPDVALTYSEWSTYATPTKSDSSNGGGNFEPPVVYKAPAGGALDVQDDAPTAVPPAPSLSGASWIWATQGANGSAPAGTVYLRKTFAVADPAALTSARLRINVDDSHATYVNGTQVALGNGVDAWRTSQLVDVRSLLRPGANVIAIAATNTSAGASGAAAKLQLSDGTAIVTDASWKASTSKPPDGWTVTAFDDSGWPSAFANASYGAGPWGTVADPGNGAGARTAAGELRGGFRYLTVENPGPGTLRLSGAEVRITFAPGMADLRAYPNYFYSSDPLLNRIWYAGAYTVQTNIIAGNQGRVWGAPSLGWDNSASVGELGDTVLVDGAKRDRTVWPGDLGISVPTDYASLGDMTTIKNSLQTLYNHQNAAGALPYAGPAVNFVGNSDAYHMWTLIGTAGYYQYTGDKAWLDAIWPKYKLALTYITAKLGGDHLLNVTQSADWARGNSGGRNIEAQAIMYRTLATCRALATAEGETALAADCRDKGAALKGAVDSSGYWDAAAGLYRDTPTSSVHPQDGNSLAVWYGLATDPLTISQALAKRWTPAGAPTPEKSSTSINPFPGSMEAMAHFAAGDDETGLDMIRLEWGYMLNAPYGTSTFWEGYKTDGSSDYSDNYVSSAHGWSSGPTSALSFYVLGIQPDPDGGPQYDLIPHPGELRHVEGSLQTPAGTISQSYDADPGAGTFSARYTAPAGAVRTVALPTYGREVTVREDGDVVTARGDGRYAYVDARPGTHELSTCPTASCGSVEVGGEVPATLSLSLVPPASFGAFTPGLAHTYTAQTTATVRSTAASATLTVSDPGHLANGAFTLARPLQVDISPAAWTGPVAEAPATIAFKQDIGANDPLRTGAYSRTLTFTLSTTAP